MLMKFPLPKALMLKRRTYSALLLGAISLSLAATACKLNPTPPDRYALVYGVSIYDSNKPEENDDLVLFYFSGHGTNSYEFELEETGKEDKLSNSADEFLVLPVYPSDYYLL